MIKFLKRLFGYKDKLTTNDIISKDVINEWKEVNNLLLSIKERLIYLNNQVRIK